MNPARIFVAAAFALAMAGPLDPALAAWSNDPRVNKRIAPSVANQFIFFSVEDGAGGAFFIWGEAGAGYGYDIHAQHLTAQGLLAPSWPAAGIIVCGAVDHQFPTAAVSDGAGGFIAAWDDYRIGTDPNIYAQHVTANGTALWAVNGAPVCTETANQLNAKVCSDREGGAIFIWEDSRSAGLTQLDLYAQRLSSTGAQLWTAGGVPVCTASGNQDFGSVVNDGTVGGAYLVWRDYRSGANSDLYALRLDRYGSVRGGWNTGGSALCSAAGDQLTPAMISDGAFGAIVTWMDTRLGGYNTYAMRMYPSGPTAPGWTVNGVALTSGGSYRESPAPATDGAGGAIIAWTDYSLATGPDIIAQRIGAGGTPAWTAGGIPLTTAPDNQYVPKVVSDGAGGAVVGWQDTRAGWPPMIFAQRVTGSGAIAAGFAPDGNPITTGSWVQDLGACSDGSGGAIFSWQDAILAAGLAQRIDRWGYLGAQPTIVSVKDVPHDQGGRVKVSWDRSPLDAYPGNAITSYQVYRSLPPQAALAALASGRAVIAEAREGEAGVNAQPHGDSRRTLLTSVLAGATYYWEYLATVAAGQLPGYSYLAATEQDSVPGSNPRTLFMIRAQDYPGTRFWLSDPDSGYSTDDVAPAAPVPFTGAYGSGATHLHWGANTEADFFVYRLYRGTTSGFVPGPGNLVTSQPDTGYVDAGAAGSYYKLIAVDNHGNESPASLLSPSGTVDVTSSPTAWALALAPALPNPSTRVTICRFTLPAEGRVRMTMHDAAGRLVRVLIDARMPAGEHSVRWSGEDEAGGRMPSGLYFARLAFGGRVMTTKVARVE